MFVVHSTSPLDSEWESRDQEIFTAAGCKSHSSGAECERGKEGVRDHKWNVPGFVEATEMARRLREIGGLEVSVREK